MQYRDLKGSKISEIGFGCSGFWGDRRFSDRKAAKLIEEAFELGINHFDTGHNYCNYNAEPRLGRALAPLLRRHDRSRFVVSTKAGTTGRKFLGFKQGTTDFSPDYMENACTKSLKNLGVDFVDVFYLHGIAPHLINDELIDRLNRMKHKGLFRLLGINTHSDPMMRHVASLPKVFDVILIDFNAAQQERIETIGLLHKAGIAVMAGNVLAQGHLIPGKIGRPPLSLSDAYYLLRAVIKPESRRLALSRKI